MRQIAAAALRARDGRSEHVSESTAENAESHNRDPADPGLDGLGEKTYRLELFGGILWSGYLAILELGPGLAKKAFDASDFEVALLTSAQSVGLILSFFTSHLAVRCSRVRMAFWLQTISNLALIPVFFLRPSAALAFVGLHGLARILYCMAIPARVLVYQTNFPKEQRGRSVGTLNRAKLVVTTGFALAISVLLDWNIGTEELVELLRPCPIPAREMARWVIPSIAVVALFGCGLYRRVPEAPIEPSEEEKQRSVLETFREFVRVWREDHAFRRYETFFFVFGFANIMSIPLTQIHAVDKLGANYFDLAMINVVLVQAMMALSMAAWGSRFDRSNPFRLRAILNIVLAIDFIVLALAPTIGWVYVGRIFRGVAMGGGTLVWMLGPLWFAPDPRREPIYTGIHSVLTGLRWGLAPFIAVWLKASFGTDSRPIFWIGAIVLILTALGMFRERVPEDSKSAEDCPADDAG